LSANRILSRLLGGEIMVNDSGAYHSGDDEIEPGETSRRGELEDGYRSLGLTIERVAETIAELPAAVPRESAVLIVRRTLEAAGVKLSELDASTREQESKLSSEMELARARQKEVSEKTQEAVRSLEEELRKAREACESVMLYEERKISRATATLKELRRVRTFFGLPRTEGEEDDAGPDEQGQQQQQQQQQQIPETFDVEQAQIFDTPLAQVFAIARPPSGDRGEVLKGDGGPRSISTRRFSQSFRQVRGDEKVTPEAKEQIRGEDEPSVVKGEVRVHKDAIQDDEVDHVDEATERLPGSLQRYLGADGNTEHRRVLRRSVEGDDKT
jgi:hypothetical protein